MKKILVTIILLSTTISYSQNFNGDYRSYKTSFQDNSSKENNFIEETEFRIAVLIDDNLKGLCCASPGKSEDLSN